MDLPLSIYYYTDKPKVVPFPHEIHGVLGEQFKITCYATNDKDAPHNMTFTWMTPDGFVHNVNMTSEDDDHTTSSTLYISRLARSDNGTYKCIVTNNEVSSTSVVTSTTVIVEGLCYTCIIMECNVMFTRTFITAIEFQCY